jgi:hypothetical protein
MAVGGSQVSEPVGGWRLYYVVAIRPSSMTGAAGGKKNCAMFEARVLTFRDSLLPPTSHLTGFSPTGDRK